MFFHHIIVFVHHQRFWCKNPNCCGSTRGKQQTFASIDPRALSKLPTCVAEHFEFVTTPGGPGIHRSMIYMFANLACKSILFGSFADTVNELLAVDYSMECASYYGQLKACGTQDLYWGMMDLQFSHTQLLAKLVSIMVFA
jgi:hypothetical protein